MARKQEDWITQSEAAELLNMQLAAVNQLVRRGVLESEIRLGKRVVSRKSVKAYTPRAERKAKKGGKK
jgi:hypothetical protein